MNKVVDGRLPLDAKGQFGVGIGVDGRERARQIGFLGLAGRGQIGNACIDGRSEPRGIVGPRDCQHQVVFDQRCNAIAQGHNKGVTALFASTQRLNGRGRFFNVVGSGADIESQRAIGAYLLSHIVDGRLTFKSEDPLCIGIRVGGRQNAAELRVGGGLRQIIFNHGGQGFDGDRRRIVCPQQSHRQLGGSVTFSAIRHHISEGIDHRLALRQFAIVIGRISETSQVIERQLTVFTSESSFAQCWHCSNFERART